MNGKIKKITLLIINGNLVEIEAGSIGQDPPQAPKGVSIDLGASK